MSTPASDSPCILVCVLDRRSGHCLGCGRTGDEITRWTAMTAGERRAVLDALPPRLAALEPAPDKGPRRHAVRQESEV